MANKNLPDGNTATLIEKIEPGDLIVVKYAKVAEGSEQKWDQFGQMVRERGGYLLVIPKFCELEKVGWHDVRRLGEIILELERKLIDTIDRIIKRN